MNAPLAHAGGWAISLDHNGQSARSAGQGETQGHVYVWQNSTEGDSDSSDAHGSGSGPLDMGQTQTASTAGSYTLVLRWTPSAKGEKIPPFVGVWFWQEAIGTGARLDLGDPKGYNGSALTGTPGSVTLTTRVAAPGGKSYSDSTHAQKLTSPSPYTQFFSYAATPISYLTLSTQGATPTSKGVTATDGSLYVTYPMPPVSATCRVTMGRYPDPDYDGGLQGDKTYASVCVIPHYDIDPHQLWITSDIEPSYYKFSAVGPAFPQNPLPDYCYLKNPDGSFQTDAAGNRLMDKGAGRPVLWADEKTGTYAIQCQRNSDGSIDVHSTYLQLYRDAQPSLGDLLSPLDYTKTDSYGRGRYTANAEGFLSPQYKWSLQGGTPQFATSDELQKDQSKVDLNVSVNANDESNSWWDNIRQLPQTVDVSGIYLGKDDGLRIKKSTFKVEVGEKLAGTRMPPLPTVPPLVNTYTVNWHEDYENYEPYGDKKISYVLYDFNPDTMSVGASQNIKADGTPATCDKRSVLLGDVDAAAQFGAKSLDTAAKFVKTPWFKTLAAAAKLADDNWHPNQGVNSATQNISGMFDIAKKVQQKYPAVGVLVPPDSLFEECRLKHLYLYDEYEITLYKGDQFNPSGFVALDKKAVAQPTEEAAIGLYEDLRTPGKDKQ